MSDFDNTNRGSIWKNDKMRPGKQDPEFTGSLNVNGDEYWVSAWKRKPDASEKAPALSFSVKRKEADARPVQSAGDNRVPARGASNNEFSDDIPF